ncbi:hypothetical protein DVH05_022764 [Phytophthora capsici]|nr:hypothetical protein DVH05_022764 [Phytophthora capsici]
MGACPFKPDGHCHYRRRCVLDVYDRQVIPRLRQYSCLFLVYSPHYQTWEVRDEHHQQPFNQFLARPVMMKAPPNECDEEDPITLVNPVYDIS